MHGDLLWFESNVMHISLLLLKTFWTKMLELNSQKTIFFLIPTAVMVQVLKAVLHLGKWSFESNTRSMKSRLKLPYISTCFYLPPLSKCGSPGTCPSSVYLLVWVGCKTGRLELGVSTQLTFSSSVSLSFFSLTQLAGPKLCFNELSPLW